VMRSARWSVNGVACLGSSVCCLSAVWVKANSRAGCYIAVFVCSVAVMAVSFQLAFFALFVLFL